MVGPTDRSMRLQEQQWWEHRQHELEQQIKTLQKQHVDVPPPAYHRPSIGGSRTQFAERTRAAALDLDREAALLELVSDCETDSSFGSSDGSSGDSVYSGAGGVHQHRGVRGEYSGDTYSESESDSDSDSSMRGLRQDFGIVELSREERLGRLSALSSDVLADE
jgi:hypothetical protein